MRMSTTALEAFPMALGCPGLMKGIKRRARQGQDDDFFPRSWPVQCAMGVVPGDSACWTRHAVGRVAPKIAFVDTFSTSGIHPLLMSSNSGELTHLSLQRVQSYSMILLKKLANWPKIEFFY